MTITPEMRRKFLPTPEEVKRWQRARDLYIMSEHRRALEAFSGVEFVRVVPAPEPYPLHGGMGCIA